MADVLQWLNNQQWLTGGANVLQWVTAVPAVALGVMAWRLRRCKVVWCLRLGQHPVRETTWKVCGRHHRPEHHVVVRAKHSRRHPRRMGHGDMP